jgi:hypothetical protein
VNQQSLGAGGTEALQDHSQLLDDTAQSPLVGQDADLEIPVAVTDCGDSWERVFAHPAADNDLCDLLRRAAVDLFNALETVLAVNPGSYKVAQQYVVDVLQRLAYAHEIDLNDVFDLVIDERNLPKTAKELATLFARHGTFLSNGHTPVKIVVEENWLPRAIEVTPEIVRVDAHTICRPVKFRLAAGRPKNGERRDLIRVHASLSTDVARLYLKGLEGNWGLSLFRGITTAPIHKNDGSIRGGSGYDEETWVMAT